jgi:hypothetical protein
VLERKGAKGLLLRWEEVEPAHNYILNILIFRSLVEVTGALARYEFTPRIPGLAGGE